MNPIPVRLAAIDPVAEDIRQFTLARADGEPLPPFSGGSHVVVTLPGEGRSHRNSYSLTGDPRDHDRYRIAVQRQPDSRGGSRFLHERARVGDQLTISPPANLFPIARLARKHILLAAGIGVTPILAQAHDLARLGATFEVHQVSRSPARAAYADALGRVAGARLHRHDTGTGRRPDLHRLLDDQPLGTHVYVCGPTGFIAAVRAAAKALGWTDRHVHSERFVAPAGGTAFEALLARANRRVTVAADTSLLEAIEQAGLNPPQLCRGGACGHCETAVLEADGRIEHRDFFLGAADRARGDRIMLCVSRLQGRRIVLDL